MMTERLNHSWPKIAAIIEILTSHVRELVSKMESTIKIAESIPTICMTFFVELILFES